MTFFSIDSKHTKAGMGLLALSMAFTLTITGCSASAALDETETDEKTAETESSADPVSQIVSMITDGDLRHAVELANMTRITAKTDHSLPEETIAVLDNLYAYCKLHQYLDTDDITAAKPWLEKLNAEELPESVKTLFDGLYAKYKDKLEN